MSYELLGLVAIIAIIVVAMITKRTTPALLTGVILMSIFVGKKNFASTFLDSAYSQGANSDLFYVILLCTFLLIFINMLTATQASTIFCELLAKKAKNARSTMIWTWIVSIALFIDESMKVAVLGTLTPLYDKNKIPRASLAYIAASMSGPLSTMIPITWWAVYCQGVFGGFDELKSMGTPLQIYLQSMPFMFYAIAALLVVTLFVFGVLPPIGAMKKVYIRAEETGELYNEAGKALNSVETAIENGKELDRKGFRLAVFIVAIIAVTAGVIITGDLVTVMAIVDFVLVLVALITKLCPLEETFSVAGSSMETVASLGVLMFCAFMFKDLITQIGFPEYIGAIAGPVLSGSVFPVVAFILCSLLTFGTGSNLGIATVFATIAVPVGISVGAAPALIVAAVVSGASFGAHACFYTDYTVTCSYMTKIDNMEHCLTQLPYCLIAAGLACIGFLVAGFVM